MTKELEEALKNIKIRCHSKSMRYDPIDFDLDTVEQALLKAEKLEKAWEVVKEKEVDIRVLNESDNVEMYNEISLRPHLIESEFTLLKEMIE